jgi:hypothetical protein
MTEHPLTNEKALSLFSFERLMDMSQPLDAEDFMRTGADWQLEQVIEWLNETISERGSSLEAVNIPEELREAMRPTTQEKTNG